MNFPRTAKSFACSSVFLKQRVKPRSRRRSWLELRQSGARYRYLPLAIALLTTAGLHTLPVSSQPAVAADENTVSEPARALSPSDRAQLMYEIMIAELAGRRGYLDIATEGYRSASERTDDPRLAERATKLAIYGRDWQQAINSGKRWSELAPKNLEALEILIQVFLRQDDAEGAAEQMYSLVQVSDAPVATTVDQIFGTVARESNATTAILAMGFLRDRLPDEVSTNLAYSRLALNQGERNSALEAIDRAIEIDPDDGEVLLVRAQILFSLGRGEEGLSGLQRAVENATENTNLHLGLARLLVDAERYEEAADEFESIFNKAGDDSHAVFTIGLLALESKRNTAAARYFERLLEIGEYESEAHFYLARIADSQQKYDEAIRHYEAVAAGETFYDAQIRAAELYGLTDRLDLARARIAELKQSSPEDFLPQLIRAEARMLSEAGQADEGLEVLTAGLEQFENHGSLLYTRALLAERQGNIEMFESDLKILIRDEPENAHALNALGYYYADENIKLDEAQDLLEKANRLLPQDPAILDSVGWLYYRQGKIDEALQFLEAAHELLADPEIAGHLGEVLWVGGQQDSARAIWDKALAESPHDDKLKSVIERFLQ